MQGEPGAGKGQRPDNGEEDEGRAEAGELIEITADHGCDHRRQDPGHGDVAQDARRFLALIEIAHDGARKDDAGCAAYRLNQAGRNQHLDRDCKGARNTRQDEEDETGKEQGPAAIAVGQRTIKQLTDRKPDEEKCQCELHRSIGDTECRLQPGHRRHEDVERQRPDGADQDKNQEGWTARLRRCLPYHLCGLINHAAFQEMCVTLQPHPSLVPNWRDSRDMMWTHSA
jgi:hypothetical protein